MSTWEESGSGEAICLDTAPSSAKIAIAATWALEGSFSRSR